MAAPHVASIIAYLLAVEGRRTPTNMLGRVKRLAPDGVFIGISVGAWWMVWVPAYDILNKVFACSNEMT